MKDKASCISERYYETWFPTKAQYWSQGLLRFLAASCFSTFHSKIHSQQHQNIKSTVLKYLGLPEQLHEEAFWLDSAEG